MTPEIAARLATLEARSKEQEDTIRGLRYEIECLKGELKAIETSHIEFANSHVALGKDFVKERKAILEVLDNHKAEIKHLALLAGNSANALFPKLIDAFEEIDRALSLPKKTD